jgi:hypothetical protein
MFLGLYTQARQPGVRSCFLRRFDILLEEKSSLIEVRASKAAKDDEGGKFFAVLGLDMEIAPRHEKGPVRGLGSGRWI